MAKSCRTHSFAEGYFRLTRVGALEMTADEAGAHERNKDVSFVHLAQVARSASHCPSMSASSS